MFCLKCGKYIWWKYSFEMKKWIIVGICSCKQTIISPVNIKNRHSTFNPFKAMYLFLKYKTENIKRN